LGVVVVVWCLSCVLGVDCVLLLLFGVYRVYWVLLFGVYRVYWVLFVLLFGAYPQ
jgi:hypothetical protein